MNKIDKHQDHNHAKSTLKKVTKKAEKKKLPATVLCGFLGSGIVQLKAISLKKYLLNLFANLR
jgi:hypothetical protein